MGPSTGRMANSTVLQWEYCPTELATMDKIERWRSSVRTRPRSPSALVAVRPGGQQRVHLLPDRSRAALPDAAAVRDVEPPPHAEPECAARTCGRRNRSPW